MITINARNFYIKVPCFFSHAYFQFFPSFGKFFPATCSVSSAGRAVALVESYNEIQFRTRSKWINELG